MNRNFSYATIGASIVLIVIVQFFTETIGVSVAVAALAIAILLLNANFILDRLNKIRLGKMLFAVVIILEIIAFFKVVVLLGLV